MKKTETGFTLIELLVVVAIIGILAAIAIPQFAEYRKRGFDSRSVSDLRNAATAEEAYYADNEVYKTCDDATACQTALPGFKSSSGVALDMDAAANSTHFTGKSSHARGNRDGSAATKYYYWNSANGGLCPGTATC